MKFLSSYLNFGIKKLPRVLLNKAWCYAGTLILILSIMYWSIRNKLLSIWSVHCNELYNTPVFWGLVLGAISNNEQDNLVNEMMVWGVNGVTFYSGLTTFGFLLCFYLHCGLKCLELSLATLDWAVDTKILRNPVAWHPNFEATFFQLHFCWVRQHNTIIF